MGGGLIISLVKYSVLVAIRLSVRACCKMPVLGVGPAHPRLAQHVRDDMSLSGLESSRHPTIKHGMKCTVAAVAITVCFSSDLIG